MNWEIQQQSLGFIQDNSLLFLKDGFEIQMSFMTRWFCASIKWKTEDGKLSFTDMIDRGQVVPWEGGNTWFCHWRYPGCQWRDGAGEAYKTPSSNLFSVSTGVGITEKIKKKTRAEGKKGERKRTRSSLAQFRIWSLSLGWTMINVSQTRRIHLFFRISSERQFFLSIRYSMKCYSSV